jgi:beta-1,4-mannosyltransferase
MSIETSSIRAASNPSAGASSQTAETLRVLAWPIDAQNPYTAALYAQMGRDVRVQEFSVASLLRRHDIWHIHWPEALLNIRNPALAVAKLITFLVMIDRVRLCGGKIIWTVHNLRAHDKLHPRLEKIFYRCFLPRVDGVISLSETGLATARKKFHRLQSLPAAVIRHGHYRNEYPQCGVDARSSLDLAGDARVLLFFGEVRTYKNVDALVRAFHDVRDPKARLLIAGRPKSAAIGESVAKEAELDRRVRLSLKFIQREQVAQYFLSSDLVVLPYRHILNSGAALLALSFNRPILVPDLGAMRDLKNDFGGDWVRTFPDAIDAVTLESALDWATQPRSSQCPMPEEYRWDTIRAQTLRFYREVISTPRS